MLSWLTARGRRAADDRRMSCRYPAVENDARLGWWSEGVYTEVAARIKDLSQGGARLTCAHPPLRDEIHIRLERPKSTAWAPAKVRKSVRSYGGSHQVSVEFPEGCPSDLFSETRGCRLEAVPEHVSSEFDGRYWR